MKYPSYISLCLLFLLVACQNGAAPSQEAENRNGFSVEETAFGSTPEGPASLFTLQNKNGITLKVTNFGGILVALWAPDRNGKLADITLGFDSLSSYQAEHPYFGSLIGRYGNRIAKGKFSVNGKEYTLAINNEPNSLHGGKLGFNRRLWDTKILESETYVGLEMKRRSPDMEEGFPGNLDVTVRYLLNNQNEWIIEYEAQTDQETPINLTQHAYFNLNGAGSGSINGHELMIKASRYTPVDATLIPTGDLASVEGTPFDFRTPTLIGARIAREHQQLTYGMGYDHNWVLDRTGDGLELAASLYARESGRFIEVLTEEPGLQFYGGNFLDGTNIGKGGKAYQHRTGLCLETQHFPDSPNQTDFPSTMLKPGETYKTKTTYRFSTK